MRRFLLLTDIPPCSNYSGGLFFDQIVQNLPVEHGVIFCVLNRMVWPQTTACRFPISFATKPNELHIGAQNSVNIEPFAGQVAVPRLLKRAVSFAQASGGVTDVLAVLEGQTMIRLAKPVADALSARLYTLVMDPPDWWMRGHGVPPCATSRILSRFDETVASSKGCIAASPAMALDYAGRYRVPTAAVMAVLSEELCKPTAPKPHAKNELRIAVAGQLYAEDAFTSLIEALEHCQWFIEGRSVTIEVFAPPHIEKTILRPGITYHPWLPQAELIVRLREADVLYCPYWFSPKFENEARLCFPSKLTTYLAAGRPVLFHGPDYASPSRFLAEHQAGALCHSQEPTAIRHALVAICQPDTFAELSERGQSTFRAKLTPRAAAEALKRMMSID